MPKIFAAASPIASDALRNNIPGSAARKVSTSEIVAKRGLDLSAAFVILMLLLPFIVTTALFMLVSQGRPVFIRHRRVGRKGVIFGCLKFRTMVVNADEVLTTHLALHPEARAEWQATRKLKDDPRITPMGQVMRKTSIDELPQLFNIVCGDMSLVGPRPIVPDEVPHYGARISLYHSVRPGLTGSWQIGGRSNVSYPARVDMDSEYVARWSLGRDISILLKTVPAVLSAKGSY